MRRCESVKKAVVPNCCITTVEHGLGFKGHHDLMHRRIMTVEGSVWVTASPATSGIGGGGRRVKVRILSGGRQKEL